MSMLQSTSHACAPVLPDAAEITLASWLAERPTPSPQAALQLITRLGNTLSDAHLRGVRHGSLSAAQVLLSGSTATSFGEPELRGFAPSAGAWPRREDVATDVAGLAGIAQALLVPVPAPPPGRAPYRPVPPPARSRATAAVIAAGMDRREGVFVFESPLDFVVALETAIAADAGAPPSPDPALLAMRRRRRRRRVLKVVTGTAVAFVALLVLANVSVAHPPSARGAAVTLQH
jgi:hypothetical protein